MKTVGHENPAFGGIYFDESGSLTVVTTDESNASAQRVVTALVDRGAVALASKSVTVVGGTYAFVQLMEWRERISSELLGSQGVVVVAISHKRNAITIGVTNLPLHESSIRSTLQGWNVPSDAYVLEETPTPVFTGNLRDRHRPLVAGLQIQGNSPTGLECTLGFTATRAGYDGFVTASHCNTPNVLDSRYGYGQPTLASANLAGWEARDTGGWNCPYGKCRWADVEFDRELAATGTTILRGYIARLTAPSPSTAWDGTTLWRIVGESFPFEGDPVRKIGISTGYTGGYIQSGCADTTIHGVRMLCLARANYYSLSGDSGGPVFRGTGQGHDVILYGIMSGQFSPTDNLFSDITAIQDSSELGTLINCGAGFGC